MGTEALVGVSRFPSVFRRRFGDLFLFRVSFRQRFQ